MAMFRKYGSGRHVGDVNLGKEPKRCIVWMFDAE